tara:strand:- start:704 stop:1438 length:735 start_codon:yes stop_codon:yes gene_type:complete
MMDNLTIAMWSGPRNLSTAMMRSFGNRNDTVVLDEPFYAHYLLKTGLNHPGRESIINSQSAKWNEIIKICIGRIPKGKSVWYQKHMAQHNLKGYDISWISNLQNCLLIRNPKYVIHSYAQQLPIKNESQLGYKQQIEILEYIKKINGTIPPIIDAKDVLLHPENILKKLCDKIGIGFSKSMLSWKKGSKVSDGIWGKYWYSSVNKSTSFIPYKKRDIVLARDLVPIYNKCMELYMMMYKHRIRP